MTEPVSLVSSATTLESSLDMLTLSEPVQCPHVQNLPQATDEPTESEDETATEYAERIQQLSTIRKALDQQTQLLYEQYAKEQHPNASDKQKELVLDMQEQYFTRYMTEVHQYQLAHQQQQLEQWSSMNKMKREAAIDEGAQPTEVEPDRAVQACPLIPATIWTRKDLPEFKQEILKTQRECCIKIGSLATATIRVPTHPEGTAIFWEFATDYYDLGFGVYFEWDLEPPTTISVNISESSDEEEDGDDEDGEPVNLNKLQPRDGDSARNDIEGGRRTSAPRPPTDELIPVYRRDCHTEVYCGSHQYPGVGVYVFKFDNSFSLWRSKWLYYRIYYTQ